MKQELDEKLCAKYPKIFVQRNMDMQQTAMCWGFECGDGWYWLIDNLCDAIQRKINHQIKERERKIEYNKMLEDAKNGDFTKFDNHYMHMSERFREKRKQEILTEIPNEIENEIHQVEAVQVKEKFGGLRFYVNGASSEIHTMISFAEHLSYSICEKCGTTENVSQNKTGWIYTLCDTCRK